MKIQYHFIVISLIFSLILSGGCAIFKGAPNKNQRNVDKAAQNVQSVKDRLQQNTDKKVGIAGTMAWGTDRALDKVENPSIEVVVAKEMNDRVLNILGMPTIDDANKIKKIVDELTSQIETERKNGIKALSEKDKEIGYLQKEKMDLEQKLKNATTELGNVAKDAAENADKYKSFIDGINRWFGLGAVFYGLKKFITTCLMYLLIGTVIFLIVRVLSTMYPAFGAIMGIFNIIGGFFLQLFKGIVPGSFKVASMTPTEEFTNHKNTLLKLVDTIEEMKSHDDIKPDNEDYMFKDFINKLSVEFGDTDKRIYNKIKEELRWK